MMISVKIYFSFSFCSDINLEGTVVKAGKIRDLISTPNTTKKKETKKRKHKIIITAYHIRKTTSKNNNDNFQLAAAL